MKSEQLRKKSKKVLERNSQKKREKLRALRFDLASGKVKNVKEVRAVKKDIARILTILKEIGNKKQAT